jgi:hypothetical protein
MNLAQPDLFDSVDLVAQVSKFLRALFARGLRPTALELVKELEAELGVEARWDLMAAVRGMACSDDLTRADRDYITALIEDGSLTKALRGEAAPDHEVISTIDLLLEESRIYHSSPSFREMIEFMGRFRDYAPYNNMLVRVQNPSCSFYATARDWCVRFRRALKEDARPMLILAPMHPVMLVYDLDQTQGRELPKELREFSKFKGDWQDLWLDRLVENAKGHRIRVDFKSLSRTHSGFATLDRATGHFKMRIAVHKELDGASRFGVLCHELAHILLGHLGTDRDHWWPGRSNLGRATVEIEAEAVAYIVSTRFGLKGSSAAYISRHLSDGILPAGVSIDSIAKVAGHIERMAREVMPPRRPRPSPKNGGRQ